MNYTIITKTISDFVPYESAGGTMYWYRAEIGRDASYVQAIESKMEGIPTEEDFKSLMDAYVDDLKKFKIKDIIKYDTSNNVNHFFIGDMEAWLDKDTRVGLMNSLTIEKNSGHETSTLYLNGVSLTLRIDDALSMLSQLELYAIDCYRKTEEHKMNVNGLETVRDVQKYDITTGYPEELHFTV